MLDQSGLLQWYFLMFFAGNVFWMCILRCICRGQTEKVCAQSRFVLSKHVAGFPWLNMQEAEPLVRADGTISLGTIYALNIKQRSLQTGSCNFKIVFRIRLRNGFQRIFEVLTHPSVLSLPLWASAPRYKGSPASTLWILSLNCSLNVLNEKSVKCRREAGYTNSFNCRM